jgi:hypothetical protein
MIPHRVATFEARCTFGARSGDGVLAFEDVAREKSGIIR